MRRLDTLGMLCHSEMYDALRVELLVSDMEFVSNASELDGIDRKQRHWQRFPDAIERRIVELVEVVERLATFVRDR